MKLLTALVATIALNCLPAWGAVAEPQDWLIEDYEKTPPPL